MPTALHETSIRQGALQCLICIDPAEKVKQVQALHLTSQTSSECDWGVGEDIVLNTQNIPGRPAKPRLVSPREVEKRGLHTPAGRAVLLHALTHIEFNAINLALDICWRFANQPLVFYQDWLRVAAEEAYHFDLLHTHLQTLSYHYGDFTAHNGLWDMAEKTKDDLLARLALVPRTLEARGLDVSPAIRDKLAQIGDQQGAEILSIILHDEIGHVAIGNRWYNALCAEQNRDPVSTYSELAKRYDAPALRGPFNLEARRAAGFSDEELGALTALT